MAVGMADLETLIDAWRTWYAGNDVGKDLIIWGMSLRWWNRIAHLMQLWTMLVVLLEVIGRERFIRFEAWAIETALPYAIRLYKRFAVFMIDLVRPFVRFVDRSKRPSVLLRISVVITIIVFVPHLAAQMTYGPEGTAAVAAVFKAVLLVADVIWRLTILYLQGLVLLSVAGPLVLFAPTIFVIVLSRLLAHRYAGNVLRISTVVVFVVGLHFIMLAI
jgi:hypothetical protein